MTDFVDLARKTLGELADVDSVQALSLQFTLIDIKAREYAHEGTRTDSIGWRVPAVPTEEGDTYWGYTSVPDAGVAWWRRLPTRQAVNGSVRAFDPRAHRLSVSSGISYADALTVLDLGFTEEEAMVMVRAAVGCAVNVTSLAAFAAALRRQDGAKAVPTDGTCTGIGGSLCSCPRCWEARSR